MRSDFERDIAKASRERRGAKLGAENLIRYFEDRMRLKVSGRSGGHRTQ